MKAPLFGADSGEDLDLGVRSPEQDLERCIALMGEAIASGMAERRYEIVDGGADSRDLVTGRPEIS